MKKLIALMGLLPMAAWALFAASNTTVTATVTDTDGQAWTNGSWKAELVLPGGIFSGATITAGGVPVRSPRSGSLNNSGVMTAVLTDTGSMDQTGVKWKITVCPNASITPYGTTGCADFTTAVTGASVDLTSKFSLLPAPRFPAGSGAFGYTDQEVFTPSVPGGTYFNTNTDKTLAGLRMWDGQRWVAGGGSGGGSSAGTPLQKGDGSGGFANATITDLNLYTPGMANVQGSTYASLFGANSVVTGGPNGPSDNPCAAYTGAMKVGKSFNYFPSAYFDYNCYVSSGANDRAVFHEFYPKTTATTGQTGYIGEYTETHDHSLGQTFYGQWHTAVQNRTMFQSSTSGIEQRESGVTWYTSDGDKADRYRYFNYASGTCTTGADECVEADALQIYTLGSYHGTVSNTVAAGGTVLYAPSTAQCGGNGGQIGTCAGAGRPVIKLGSAQTLTVTGLTYDTPYTGFATLTTVQTLSNVSPANGVVTAAAPVTTDFYNGDTFTSAFTVSSGIMPSSGTACWLQDGANALQYEAVTFTYSSGNITITDHRRQHGASSVLYVGDCEWFSPSLDSTAIGSETTYIAIPTGTNTLIVTTQLLNNPSYTWLGKYGFNPSLGAGRQTGTLYTQGVRAISVSDPTATSPALNGARPDEKGFFKLESHTFGFNQNDLIAQSLLPVEAQTARFTSCGSNQPSNARQSSSCYRTLVNGLVDSVEEIDLNINPSLLSTGTGYFGPPNIFTIRNSGAYNTKYTNLFNLVNPPTNIFSFNSTPTSRVNIVGGSASTLYFDPTANAYGVGAGNFNVQFNATVGGTVSGGNYQVYRASAASPGYIPGLSVIRPYTGENTITVGPAINGANSIGYASGALEEGSMIVNGSSQIARPVAANPIPQLYFASSTYGTNGSITPVSTPTGTSVINFGYSCDSALNVGAPMFWGGGAFDPSNANPAFTVILPKPNTSSGVGTECNTYSLWYYASGSTSIGSVTNPYLSASGLSAGATVNWTLQGTTAGSQTVPNGRNIRNINSASTAARFDVLSNGLCFLYDTRAATSNSVWPECQSGLSYGSGKFSFDTTTKGNGAATIAAGVVNATTVNAANLAGVTTLTMAGGGTIAASTSSALFQQVTTTNLTTTGPTTLSASTTIGGNTPCTLTSGCGTPSAAASIAASGDTFLVRSSAGTLAAGATSGSNDGNIAVKNLCFDLACTQTLSYTGAGGYQLKQTGSSPSLTLGLVKADFNTPNTIFNGASTPITTCTVSSLGFTAIVNDATSPTYMGAYVSGGSITAQVLCSYNGTSYSWVTH